MRAFRASVTTGAEKGFFTGFSSSMLHVAMKERTLSLLNGLTCFLYESIVCRIEAATKPLLRPRHLSLLFAFRSY
jgi:hypothetical protein